jgi:hypothetical protein
MSTPHDPKSLGKVVVAVPGTPVPIKASSFIVKGMTAQSDPQNVGTYCYLKDINGNIMFKVTKGQSATPPMTLGGNYDLSQVQVDSDTANDGFYITYV